MQRLKTDLRRLWSDQSPEVAVKRLREVLATLRDSEGVTVGVEPYGRLSMGPAVTELTFLLYEYEAALGHWEAALGVAEEMIALMGPRETGYWSRSRARCLLELGRQGEAMELLFSIRDPGVPDPEIEDLLERARRSAS